MEKKQLLNIARTLVSDEINRTIERWSDEQENLNTYVIRYKHSNEMGFSIQPTYSDTFFSIDRYIEIAKALQLSFYVTVEPNKNNINTPTLYIYR